MIENQLSKCEWCLGDPLYERYHDTEWGVPCFDDHTLFEFLVLESAQAGLSWITILKKGKTIEKHLPISMLKRLNNLIKARLTNSYKTQALFVTN
jgi:hypothetical protein